MDVIEMESWHDFAVASAGAAGALAGLIIVAVSVNVKEIIAGSALPARAGATIASVVLIVVSGIAMLIPRQTALALGSELVVFALIALGLQLDSTIRTFAFKDAAVSVNKKIGQAVFGFGQLVLVLVGGIVVLAGSPGGLYWVASGFIVIFIVSVLNAWVLMVEILR
jgi:modulator of FtsH protease